MVTKPEFLVAEEKMLVALETIWVAISSPVRQDINSGCFCCVVQYHSKWATATFLLHLAKDAHFPSYSRLTECAIIKMCVNTSYQRAYKTAFAVSGIQELWQKIIYFQERGLPCKPSSRCHEQKKSCSVIFRIKPLVSNDTEKTITGVTISFTSLSQLHVVE